MRWMQSSMAAMVLAAASTAMAQDSRVEVTPFVGYTFSEGFTIDPVRFQGERFDKINPTSGFSWGVAFDVNLSENMAVGFLFDEEQSNLEASGSTKVEFTDLKVRNYHGTFTYTFFDERDGLRPFVLGGLGATQYSPGDIRGVDVESATKFSTTWGGGVKAFFTPNIGIRGMARWTPTLVQEDPAGIWCSPFWPWICYQLVDTDYSNQFELSIGATFRF